jgi:hypothetical protein
MVLRTLGELLTFLLTCWQNWCSLLASIASGEGVEKRVRSEGAMARVQLVVLASRGEGELNPAEENAERARMQGNDFAELHPLFARLDRDDSRKQLRPRRAGNSYSS